MAQASGNASSSRSTADSSGSKTAKSRPVSPLSSRSASAARTSPTQVVSGFAAPSRKPSKAPVSRSQGTTTNTSRTTTPSSSTPNSRRSSLVLDPSAYRYSLNVGGISRFPANDTSGAREILRASKTAAAKEEGVDPSRASVSSDASSSRLSSRYTAEEVAPQRRPVYLALPSNPEALGPWSNTSSTLVAQGNDKDSKDVNRRSTNGEPRRNSKIMTTFPFPHPTTPSRRRGDNEATITSTAGLGAAWQRFLTAIFAGPYERQLNREEQEDDRITQSLIQDIARRNGSPATAIANKASYGSIPTNTDDPEDPYGYRQLAGPHLLPEYTTDLVARRRERRRARSRARFQCMALWTIWTVSIVLVLIVGVLVFSFVFPDRLDIPNRSDEGEEDGLAPVVGVVMVQVARGLGRNAMGGWKAR